jgi:hypothetical protein
LTVLKYKQHNPLQKQAENLGSISCSVTICIQTRAIPIKNLTSVISQNILDQISFKVLSNLVCSMVFLQAGCCEHGNEPSIKDGEFFV